MSNALSRKYFCQKYGRLMAFSECVAHDCRFILNSSCNNDSFTEGEYKVLSLLCAGVERSALHKHTFNSKRTIDSHIKALFFKSDTHSVAALVAKAFNQGWVRPKCPMR